ncbi:MAG: Sua5/YciO/YrdC/YwlC family protein [Saprospiraceae bacterium]|nr:Sua5/YciO/YrdC/YwlC family protein [Saprospiraceae bacterium]HRJ15146.1 Sua5/YciO/YrdC/YwlC family protein [Saprospiraceae bacterium]HRK83203.1 Sua5/YciO/YrdC/YwlC family protein [Saprospiraceae bacterium]
MTTSTHASASWLTYPSDLDGALRTLENGGLVLFPTDTIWSVGCSVEHPAAIRRLLQLTRLPDATQTELLVWSLEALKQLTAHLHPRLETLLYFHQRPLTVVAPGADHLPEEALHPDGSVALRIVRDSFCVGLLQAFGGPVLSAPAVTEGAPYPATFGGISSEIIQGCNHVVRHRQSERSPGEPSVMVRLSEETEELEFLRE